MAMDELLASRIEDCVSWWHDVPGQADVPLHIYLGMTWDEYGYWLRTGELAPEIELLEANRGSTIYYWPRAGTCWVCGTMSHYLDMDFQAPACGGICIWAAWEALRLHDTPWRAWC